LTERQGVRTSSDAALIGQLLGLHYPHVPRVLDATWGYGRIWRGCAYQPTVRFDMRPLPMVDVVGDWSELPRHFAPGSFEVIAWDPPHQTDGGAHALGGHDWADGYGTAGEGVRGYANVTHLYGPFLDAARPLLDPRAGLLLCKLADQVHMGLQHLQAVDFVVAARTAGWTVCEMVPKLRRPGPMDPRWRRQFHVRKAWSYWICAHPGPRCPAVGVALVRPCEREGCPRTFRASHSDAMYCSQACQKRVWRRQFVRESTSAALLASRTSEAS